MVLEKTLESPLDCKEIQEIQPVHSEGDQPLDFFGRTDAMLIRYRHEMEESRVMRKGPE